MMRAMTKADVPRATGMPFPPLPDVDGRAGGARRVGVEIEFGGLDDSRAAEVVRGCLGGRAKPLAAGEWHIDGTAIGAVQLYLDTALRPDSTSRTAERAVDLARSVVPLEIVTEPLAQTDLPRVERLLSALEEAGAHGSTDRLAYGFGLHLNVALADPEGGADLPRGALAFALLEPWLRARDPLDISRRVLPFTSPFPPAFADDLARHGRALTLPGLFDALDRHVSNRNHGLDLLPAYAHLAPGRFGRRTGRDGAVAARPAYHYRMPEARIGTPGWSLSYEWRRWVLVERVAAADALLDRLCALRPELRDLPLLPAPQGWQDRVTEVLGPLAALAPEGGPMPPAGATP